MTPFRLSALSLLAAASLALTAAGAGAQTAAANPAAPAAPASDAAASYAPQKVVYHLNGPAGDGNKSYLAAMGNIRNHLNAVGKDNIDLRVVLHGPGLDLLVLANDDQNLQGAITDLRNQGVQFVVCNNTLVSRKIEASSLFEVEPGDVVPSGVAELAKLQGEGFAYIKP